MIWSVVIAFGKSPIAGTITGSGSFGSGNKQTALAVSPLAVPCSCGFGRRKGSNAGEFLTSLGCGDATGCRPDSPGCLGVCVFGYSLSCPKNTFSLLLQHSISALINS